MKIRAGQLKSGQFFKRRRGSSIWQKDWDHDFANNISAQLVFGKPAGKVNCDISTEELVILVNVQPSIIKKG